MHVPDLAPIELPGIEASRLRAVGWLEHGNDFHQGTVSPEFMRALVELLRDPWQPFSYAGIHRCSFCRFTGGPIQLTYEGIRISMGSTNLFVPDGSGVVYVSPSLVAHYIDSHEYAPPEEFQHAVLTCLPMRSVAYLKQIKGLRG